MALTNTRALALRTVTPQNTTYIPDALVKSLHEHKSCPCCHHVLRVWAKGNTLSCSNFKGEQPGSCKYRCTPIDIVHFTTQFDEKFKAEVVTKTVVDLTKTAASETD